MMKNKKKLWLTILLIIVFLSIFILNQKTLYISDDFLYRFEFKPGMSSDIQLNPVDGVTSLLRSQYFHYSLWNGRFVAHTIVQFFMQFDKLFFNIANSVVYILLGLLILKIGMYITNKKFNILSLIIIYILLFLTIPNFGQTVLWISGSGNYLWMSIIYLSFYYYNLKDREDNWKSILNSVILGFLAGATNENTGPATILMVICIMLFHYYKTKSINIWRLSGVISSIIGFLLILFSPAATKRVAERNEVSMTISSIIENVGDITQYIVENYMAYLLIISLLLLVLYKKRKLTQKILINIIILFVGFLGSTYSLAAVDKIIERTLFGSVVFLITIVTVLLLLFFEYIANPKVIMLSILPMILIYAYTYSQAFTDINKTYNVVSEQYEIILTNPNEDVEVPMIEKPETDYNAYNNGTNYLKENNDAWLNKWAARFFGVKSIGGIDE